jgi:NhaP-type Na+/H+ or K+/H+ antiporter
MAMLVAFVLFGALLSSMTGLIPIGATLLFAVLVIAVVRPLVMALVLRRATASRGARAIIGWFGPRGLSSLLLALLVVEDGVPGSERLLAITGAVVILSVIAHGASVAPLGKWYGQQVARQTLPEEREGSAAGLFGEHDGQVPRIKPDELAAQMEDPNPPIILDVRSRSQFTADGGQIPGSIRVRPDEVIEWATGKSRDRLVVAYCT